MNSRKRKPSSNCTECFENQTRIGKFACSQKFYIRKTFEPCFHLFKKNEFGYSKKGRKFILVKKEEKYSRQMALLLITILKTLDSFQYWNSPPKNSIMDQQLANCNKLYDIATYKRRKVCVTIMKYNVNKPPYIQI